MDKESKKLSSEDIKNLITESEKFKNLPAIHLGDLVLDLQSFFVAIISIVIWIIIWFVFNLWNIVPFAKYFFFAYLFLTLLNLYNSATNVSDPETERVNLNSQQSFIQGGLSVTILAFVFLSNISIQDDQKTNIYKVLINSLIICSIGIIVINIKNESVNIRFVRKIQQSLYNMSIVLFIMSLYMIFVYKTNNAKKI